MDSEPLLELVVCEDPLCGESIYRLIQRHGKDGIEYISVGPEGDEKEILTSNEQLSDAGIIELLNREKWFGADLALQTADLCSLDDVSRLLDGAWPLFTIRSSIDGIEQKFREWVINWVAK
jgi:hypothetical protein